MQKIVPHLWYDKEAVEAAEFYVSVFGSLSSGESKVNNVTKIHNTPSGDCDIVSFKVWGCEFQAISAGPYFKLNPAISFMVNFDPSQDADAKNRIEEIWKKLLAGGKALMPIDKYPWSERYGWVEDKYGLTWQLILTNPEGDERPLIVPSLLFTNDHFGKAEAAVNFYISVFKDAPKGEAKLGNLMHYGPNQTPNKEGTVMFSDFKLFSEWFVAMDGAGEHKFNFNEAVSLMVNCDTQEEIDYYTEKLSAVPEAEQCGWLKDQFGVSWQITPKILDDLLARSDEKTKQRVTEAFLKMKKFDIATLEAAAKAG